MAGHDLLQRLQQMFAPRVQQTMTSSFKAFGEYWFAVWSNNFVDREGEAFSEKALDDYVARVSTGVVPMPELWFWHLPLRAGAAMVVARHGHMMIAAGKFYDTEVGRAFRDAYARVKQRFAVSHGFFYPRDAKRDGVYHEFTTFEISPLPIEAAANPFTEFLGDVQMVTDEQRKMLEKMFGKQRAEQLLADVEGAGETVKSAGVAYKQVEGESEDQWRMDVEALAASVRELVDMMRALIETLTANSQSQAEGAAESVSAQAQKVLDMEQRVTEAVIRRLNEQLPTLLNDAVKALAAQQAQGLAPRAASQSPATQVTPTDPVLMQYIQEALKGGQETPKSNLEKLRDAMFPGGEQ